MQLAPDIETPYLDKYTEDFNQKIANTIDQVNVTGRDKEMHELELALIQQRKNNPLLLGKAAVGKTAIVELLVKNILTGNVPPQLKGKEIRSLELSSLENSSDGENLQSKLKKIIDELKRTSGQYILFIDEIHTIVHTGGQSGSALDAGNILKQVMARGEIQLIGATTLDEYHQYIEGDEALERRFQLVNVPEPSAQETFGILKGIVNSYQKGYGIMYNDKVLRLIVELSDKYLTSRNQPDKSIDVLDQAGAIATINQHMMVSNDAVYQTIERMTGVPTGKLTGADAKLPQELPAAIKQRVKGQDAAVDAICRAIIRNKAKLTDPTKPIASYIFLGTTGVGKTELAKALTESLFGNEDKYIRFNMSEFKTKSDIKDFRVRLTEEVKHQQFAVVLFDEMEKADASVMDLYLQILDDGVLSDEYGNQANFRNCVIIFTTNVGAEFVTGQETYHKVIATEHDRKVLERQVDQALKNHFRPEFVNRIDVKAMFNMLTEKDILNIVHMRLNHAINVVQKEYPNVTIKILPKDKQHEDDLYTYLARVGYDKDNGARPINRTIDRVFNDPISLRLLKWNEIKDPLLIEISIEGKAPNQNSLQGNQEVKFRVTRK